MSRKITSKKVNRAKKVSHAHNRTNKSQKLNFQYVTINGIRFKTTAREARILRRMTNK